MQNKKMLSGALAAALLVVAVSDPAYAVPPPHTDKYVMTNIVDWEADGSYFLYFSLENTWPITNGTHNLSEFKVPFEGYVANTAEVLEGGWTPTYEYGDINNDGVPEHFLHFTADNPSDYLLPGDTLHWQALTDSPCRAASAARYIISGNGDYIDSTAIAFPSACAKGDMNADGCIDSRDVPLFVATLLQGTGDTPFDTWLADMNEDEVVDGRDIAGFFAALTAPPIVDCNNNGISDACETDCNDNGIPDDCDVDPADPDGDGVVSPDCDENGVPDECQPDCNNNDVIDACEAYSDCNLNGIPDECELAGNDCNANGIPDDCDIGVTDAPLAYFPFDGDFDDHEFCGFVGQPQGDPQFTTGVIGQALDLDGVDDWVRVDHGGKLTFDVDEQSYSIVALVRVEATDGEHCVIQDRYGANIQISYNVSLHLTPGNPRISSSTWYGPSNNINYFVNGPAPSPDTWYHVAVTHTAGDGKRLYVDGVLVDDVEQPTAGFPATGNTTLTIGSYYGSSGIANYFKGQIDELRIYGRALSEQEVIALYDETH